MNERKDNSGVLFNNDRKTKDSQPDFSGNALINGVDIYISALKKNGAKGEYFSLAFKVKESN